MNEKMNGEKISDCPILKENEDLKAENERLKKQISEIIEEIKSNLSEKVKE